MISTTGYGRYVDYCIKKKCAPMSRKKWQEKVRRELEHLEFMSERYNSKKIVRLSNHYGERKC